MFPIKPKKKLSQNFLHDEFILQNITQSLQIKDGDLIVEIGPGSGNLTAFLLKQCNNLHTIEIDDDMVLLLKTRFKENPKLTIHHNNILKFDIGKQINLGNEQLKVVANLPYHLTSPILFYLYKQQNIKQMILMMQKEVALRIVASANHKDFSRISVVSQIYADIEYLFDVPNSSFWPKPKVDSAVLRFTLKPLFTNNIDEFEKFIKICFSQKRKKISNNLKSNLDETKFNQLLKQSEISLDKRPDSISIEEYKNLFKKIY